MNFDRNASFQLELRGEVFRLHFPDDARSLEYLHASRRVETRLGRGKTRIETLTQPAIDSDIVANILISGAIRTPADATRLMAAIENPICVSAVPLEDCPHWRVTMRPFKYYEVAIDFRVPSWDEILDHHDRMGRGKTVVYQGAQTITAYRYESDLATFDRLLVATKGYADDVVPAIHKIAAVEFFLGEFLKVIEHA